MTRLDTFTIQELAECAEVLESSVRSVLERRRDLVEIVGRDDTGRPGNRPVRYRLASGKRAAVHDALSFKDLLADEAEPDRPSTDDPIIAVLQSALTALTEHWPREKESEQRRVLEAVRRNLALCPAELTSRQRLLMTTAERLIEHGERVLIGEPTHKLHRGFGELLGELLKHDEAKWGVLAAQRVLESSEAVAHQWMTGTIQGFADVPSEQLHTERYEFSDPSSNAFWEIKLSGKSLTTSDGKIGADAPSTVRTFSSDAEARKEHDRLVEEKLKRGYELVGSTADATTQKREPIVPTVPRAPVLTPPVRRSSRVSKEPVAHFRFDAAAPQFLGTEAAVAKPRRSIGAPDTASVRMHIAAGVNMLADAVKFTLGPRGRNVVIEKSWGAPIVTKDGVTISREIELEEKFEKLGAQMVKTVASKTSDIAGDGTTTATVLAQSIYAAGVKLVAVGASPMDIKRGIDSAVMTVVAELKQQSKPTRNKAEIAQVGTISANGDSAIGALIAEAIERVGKDGVIAIDDAETAETTLEVVAGVQFDCGYASPYFVTDSERMEVELVDACILICEKRLSSMRDLLPLLELVAKEGTPLVVIAEEVEGELLATLVVNKLRRTLSVCAVNAPRAGEQRKAMLRDIAALTGGQAVTEDRTPESLTLGELGRAKRVLVTKDNTTIIEGAGTREHIEERVGVIDREIAETTSDYDRAKLQERRSKLVGGVAVIRIGAATDVERKGKRALVEDAMHAARAAFEEGIVPGGGIALLRCAPALSTLQFEDDRQHGVNIIRRALEEPLRQIAENSGIEGGVVVDRVRESRGAFGYNAASGEYEDLVKAGIIDPTKVVRVALQNAASVASLLLTTEVLVAEPPPSATEET